MRILYFFIAIPVGFLPSLLFQTLHSQFSTASARTLQFYSFFKVFFFESLKKRAGSVEINFDFEKFAEWIEYGDESTARTEQLPMFAVQSETVAEDITFDEVDMRALREVVRARVSEESVSEKPQEEVQEDMIFSDFGMRALHDLIGERRSLVCDVSVSQEEVQERRNSAAVESLPNDGEISDAIRAGVYAPPSNT